MTVGKREKDLRIRKRTCRKNPMRALEFFRAAGRDTEELIIMHPHDVAGR